MFDVLAVANRGEIALRVIRGARELGVRTVALYSDADVDALHVHAADVAHRLGPAAPAESYLHIERVIEAALAAGADAIHPGYGFLSENADFARAVADAGMVFVGPSPESIISMGDKLSARDVAIAAGVPVVPGTTETVTDPAVIEAFGAEHGWPLAIKAAHGGGGRGMKIVRDPANVASALAAAQSESKTAFGRSECYVERFLERPRHVEVQILGDGRGRAIHLFGRDCSLQRRNQKLVEEAPVPNISDEVFEAVAGSAVQLSEHMTYAGAGTCEYLLDADGTTFYFLEMNTRLQVEHPVTELVTGVDLVHEQLRIAAGEGLAMEQDDVEVRGHAIEVRINAEDVAAGFLPALGTVEALDVADGPGVRFDGAIAAGMAIPEMYDSMIGKLIVHAPDRPTAIARLGRALDETRVGGVKTTLDFHRFAVDHPDFAAATHSTASVEQHWDLDQIEPAPDGSSPRQDASSNENARSVDLTVEVEGRRHQVRVHGVRPLAPARRAARRSSAGQSSSTGGPDVVSPMRGVIARVEVAVGDVVDEGQTVAVVEAMKMENQLSATVAGAVTEVLVSAGDSVDTGDVVVRVDPADAPES